MDQPKKFATTRWSLVLAAGKAPTADARAALSTLCGLYWYPLYAFARRSSASPDEAADLTQGFFAQFLEKNDLSSADPSRGRFRTWLLACFKHFSVNARVHARAQKRGGGLTEFSIDGTDAEGRYQVEPSHQLTADRLYERRWTLSLLEQAHEKLRAEYAAGGKLALFDALKGSLMGEPGAPYAELGLQLGMSEGAIKVAVHRLRKRHQALVLAVVAETVERPEDVDAELRELLANLE